MRALRGLLAMAVVCVSAGMAGQTSPDLTAADRVLGPQWKQLSRRAGIIFAGTVLSTSSPIATVQTAAVNGGFSEVIPASHFSFRVDEAIAGVEPGELLTIYEWTGARSMQRPLIKGQHILIFLYPLSRLRLTSPVGGQAGQIALDSSGKSVYGGGVSVLQLERAIRSAREE
jgi:hypothetical protein